MDPDQLASGKPYDLDLQFYTVTVFIPGYTQIQHGKGPVLREPGHKISNNVVCATSKGSDQPKHQGPSWPRILGRSDFSLQEN